MAADVAVILKRWDAMKQVRLQHEQQWQQICDYFLPKSTLTVGKQFNELRSRRVSSSVPQTALRNCAALLLGYSIDHTRPFLKPNVERGLVSAGRSTNLSAESTDYLDTLQWQIFDRMMLPQSGFIAAASRVAMELPAYGTAIQWIGRKRGFGPRFQARPLRACWIAENADGEIDTVYYAYRQPAWRVLALYPEAASIDKIVKAAAGKDGESADVELLHVCEPRRGGKAGNPGEGKPFADLVIAWEHKAVLTEAGYDSFPFQVPRLGVEDGSPYGSGLAWRALPDAKVLNHMQEMTELGLELRVMPPTMTPGRLFGKPLDRRPGANNVYDTSALGFMDARNAIQRLDVAGDVNLGVEYMSMLAQNVERALSVDWMRLLANPNMTATQTLEIRDQQLRGMASLVPGLDREWFGAGADRIMAVMGEEGLLAAPPEDLAGLEVDWDYAGPLAIAQQRGLVDVATRLVELQRMALEADPTAMAVVAVEEGLRTAAEALGAPPAMLIPRETVEGMRAAKQAQQEQAAQQQAMMAQAGALRDGAQGVASLAQAGAAGGGGDAGLAA
jgi:hypothetical protein